MAQILEMKESAAEHEASGNSLPRIELAPSTGSGMHSHEGTAEYIGEQLIVPKDPSMQVIENPPVDTGTAGLDVHGLSSRLEDLRTGTGDEAHSSQRSGLSGSTTPGGTELVTNLERHGGSHYRSAVYASADEPSQLAEQVGQYTVPASPTSMTPAHPEEGSKRLTIVLKLGTSSICDPVTHTPMLANLSSMVETVVRLRNMGHYVVLVSSGAVGIGLRRLNMKTKPKQLALVQAVAATGQGRMMALWDDLFSQLGQPIAQILLTRSDLAQRTQYLNAVNTLEALLIHGVVPIANENDTVSSGSLRFGDNDTLAGIVAGMVHADYLFLLTDVEQLYTDNPRTNPAAKPVKNVEDVSSLRDSVNVTSMGSSVGTGGMQTKLVAAELATAAGVTTFIMLGSTPHKVIDVIDFFASRGNSPTAECPDHLPCTRFLATQQPMIDRKWWILHGLKPAGEVFLDAGAVVAVMRYRKSLFATGIARVEGSFARNQTVRILFDPTSFTPADISRINNELPGLIAESSDGETGPVEIARGLANYSCHEVARIRGRRSSDFESLLGYIDHDSVVHRGNIAITAPDLDHDHDTPPLQQ